MVKYLLGCIAITLLLSERLVDTKKMFSGKLVFLWRIVAAGILFVLLAAWRDPLAVEGSDIYNYAIHYQSAASIPFWQFMTTSTFEPGYTLLVWLLHLLIPSFNGALVVFYGVMFAMFAWFLMQTGTTRSNPLGIAALVVFLFPSLSMLRNYMAICIGLLVFVQASKHRFISAYCLSVAAALFHFSAVIMVAVVTVIWLFDREDFQLKRFLLLGAITLAVEFLLSFLLPVLMAASQKYSYYVANRNGSISMGVLLATLYILVISYPVISRLKKRTFWSRSMLFALAVSLLIVPIQLQFGIFHRMSIFFIPLQLRMLLKLQHSYSRFSNKWIAWGVIYSTDLFFLYRIAYFFLREMPSYGLI